MKHFNDDHVKKTGGVMLDYQILLLSISKECKEIQSNGTNENYPNGIRHNPLLYQLELCTSKIIRCRLTAAYSVKPISQSFQIIVLNGITLYSNEAKLKSLNWI